MSAPHAESQPLMPMSSAGVLARLVFAWAFVGVPLVWGVYRTYKTAEPLFVAAPAAAAPDQTAPVSPKR
ncbi:MAG TPA: hypothetical protein VHX65_19755 [Pirellulales bacterium]|jgi:hypothetical protein|nr:hypothetical protein [Pirellulales bacterium]